MATKAVKRRAHTSLVLNPAPRGLSIGGRTTARKSTAARKSNPTARTSAVSNPRRRKSTRRRRNPAGGFSILRNPSGGAIMGAIFAGAGFSFLNLGLARIMPTGSPVVQIGLKVGVGFLVQQFGNRVPVFGKHKDGIAFLLFALAAKEAVDYWLLPTVRNTVGQLYGQATSLLQPAPASTLAGVYGSTATQYRPVYN